MMGRIFFALMYALDRLASRRERKDEARREALADRARAAAEQLERETRNPEWEDR